MSMFVDMRGSTQMAADQLPFDTVFIVNRFLEAVSLAVTQAGGKVNQYLGDLFALFGVETDPRSACCQASQGGRNDRREHQASKPRACRSRAFPPPIRHWYQWGRIGSGENIAFTVLGDQ